MQEITRLSVRLPRRPDQGVHGCTPSTVTKYQKRILGPLLDRIDIHIEVPRVEYQKLSGDRTREASAVIQERVEVASKRQSERFAGLRVQSRETLHSAKEQMLMCNADMRVGEIRQFCKLDEAGESLIRAAVGLTNLSTR